MTPSSRCFSNSERSHALPLTKLEMSPKEEEEEEEEEDDEDDGKKENTREESERVS